MTGKRHRNQEQNQRNRRRRWARTRALEILESRYAMHGEPATWDNASALTLSFAPEGTKVGSHISTLDAAFSTVESTDQWQAAVARAFQTWAQYANINIGIVGDTGLPLGIRGASHGDDQFCDIRVAGSPMSSETLVAAIDQTRLTSGTWTGDVLFNTEGAWTTPNDIYSAALHEAGHVLGLSHSTETNSPMFTHGISNNLTPTANDIAALQALYGPRVPDENERTQDNDSLGRATKIRYSEPNDGFNGTLPLVQYGDLHAANDADYFSLPVLTGYTGSLTFEVRTAGMSLLAPRISLFNQSGTLLGEASSSGTMGGTASATISGPYGERVYARVDSVAGNEYEFGGYSLVVKYDSLNTASEAEVVRAVSEGFRWRGLTDDTFASVDVRPFLAGAEAIHFDEDSGTDDTTNSGKHLKPVVDTTELRKFQYIGSISNGTDADHYILRAPAFSGSVTRGLTVTVESLELEGVIGTVEVFDTRGDLVPIEMIANGSGLVELRVASVESNKDYTVAIRTQSTTTGPATGDYAFSARFDDVDVQRETFLTTNVSPTTPMQGFQLFVAKTQLFNFAMESTAAPGFAGAFVWVTIYDDQNRPVFLAASIAGAMRSVPSVLLDPGAYYVQVSARMPDGVTPASASVTLVGEQASDPEGPPMVDPNNPPIYQCESGPDPYCYPGGVVGVIPFVIVPGPPIPTVDPPPDVTTFPIADPGDAWFWHNFHAGTNEVMPVDVSGDGTVAPLDALLVINQLNEFGAGPMPPMPIQSPFYDVSADLLVAPLDALMVINQLNGVPSAEGERAFAIESTSASSSAAAGVSVIDSFRNDQTAVNAANLVDAVWSQESSARDFRSVLPATIDESIAFSTANSSTTASPVMASRTAFARESRSSGRDPKIASLPGSSAPVGLGLAEDRRLDAAAKLRHVRFSSRDLGRRAMEFKGQVERGGAAGS